jgi:arginase
MNICVLLVPYDSGHYRARMGRGPQHLFESSIQPLLTRLQHDFRIEEITIPDSFPAEIKTAFALSAMVAERVRARYKEGWFPLVLSGNCNTAVGTVSGCGCENTGVIWFDAHGEATTPETTTSGFLDGMGISMLTGECWKTLALSIPGFQPMPGERIALVGSRDLEESECALLDRVGVRRVARAEDLNSWARQVYTHFDLDVLDPQEAVWNQWTPPGGLTVDALKNCVIHVRQRTTIAAAGFASYDPEADRDGRASRAAAAILESLIS